jgi:putative addiction module CopG family antidote
MPIQVAPDLEAMIRRQVDSGRYATVDDLLREALRSLDDRERLQRLRASLDEADAELDRGDGDEWTPALMEQISREADELYRRGATPDPDVCP